MDRRRFWFFSVLITAVVVTMAACGGGDDGGGGAADMMEITITSSTGTTTTPYIEGPINIHGYYDPYMEANIAASTGRTWITLSSGVVGGATPPDIVINIVTDDHLAKGYPITGDGGPGITTYISYTDNGVRYGSIISSGTVTIESIGNVGDPVKGTFNAVVDSGADTLTISGTFNVKREN